RRPEALLANDEQLLEKLAGGEARVVMRDSGNWLLEAITSSNDSRYVDLREALKNQLIIRPKTVAEVWDLVEGDDNYVFLSSTDVLLLRAANRCDTIVVKS
ncbi:hypothetical protein AAVH_39094, partial [Aphelenchoides avenae]